MEFVNGSVQRCVTNIVNYTHLLISVHDYEKYYAAPSDLIVSIFDLVSKVHCVYHRSWNIFKIAAISNFGKLFKTISSAVHNLFDLLHGEEDQVQKVLQGEQSQRIIHDHRNKRTAMHLFPHVLSIK